MVLLFFFFSLVGVAVWYVRFLCVFGDRYNMVVAFFMVVGYGNSKLLFILGVAGNGEGLVKKLPKSCRYFSYVFLFFYECLMTVCGLCVAYSVVKDF